MVDIFRTPILTTAQAAKHLQIPRTTLHTWVQDDQDPLVHRVADQPHGWPTIPFTGVVEAHVLRVLRHELRLSMPNVRRAAMRVREEFGTPYALATKRIATDGVDLFIQYAAEDLERAHDRQRPFREVIDAHLRYIGWEDSGRWPTVIRLQQYEGIAPVVIDPRFAWGQPVVEQNRVPVAAVYDMWRAGDEMSTIAEEFDLTREQVEAICRAAA